jgi:hypothetical protein
LKIFLIIVFVSISSFVYSAALQLSLNHVLGNEPLVLSEKQYCNPFDEKISVTQVKYYIGNIVLTYNSGEKYLDTVNYHLVDFEDPASMTLHLQNIPEGILHKIEFGIGVDSLSNAKGLMDGALDPMNGMYWAWSSGFINFKLEGECFNCGLERTFNYHIGGFLAPKETYQKATILLKKNIVTATEIIALRVDLALLFSAFKITDLPRIMSPSLKAKQYAKKLSEMFSIQQ